MAITLIPVTESNRKKAESLQVYDSQIHFIETVAQCMEEADQLSQWHPVALMHEGTLVGFSMFGYFEENGTGRLWFDRLLIDRHYQGHSFGHDAMSAVLHKMRQDYPPQDIYLSVYDPNKQAIAMYEHYGFRFNGELDTGGERIMVLPKNSPLPY